MPRKPKRPCAFPGCPNLTDGRYCEAHAGQEKKERKDYDRYIRRYAHSERYGARWSRIRERYVTAHPFCERCFKEGRLVEVEEVHHIIPLSRGGDDRETNLMSLCRSCHQRIHRELGDR